MTDDQWDDVIDTNLRGTFLFTRAASRHMMSAALWTDHQHRQRIGIDRQRGTDQLLGLQSGDDWIDSQLSKELASRKVTVNAVAPGFIESDMTQRSGDAILDEVKKRIPANRLGVPEDMAASVLFLVAGRQLHHRPVSGGRWGDDRIKPIC